MYLSFDEEAAGDVYVEQLERLLDRGVVPDEFMKRMLALRTIREAIREYQRAVVVPVSDAELLGVIEERKGKDILADVDYQWAEAWLQDMKLVRRLAPSTIRHHVGALARCFDWVLRRHPGALQTHPLRTLPRRYAAYGEDDKKATEGGRVDTERDRRLLEGEEERIRMILAGEKPVGRQRTLELHEQEALSLLFDLALETAMRLREMFTLEHSQVDLVQRTVFLEKTKNGDKRQVPLSSVALSRLEEYGAGSKGLLFPWWDGEIGRLAAVTSRLSRQFRRVFDAAGCDGLRFHDLRHEATCRLYERTHLSDLQIAKITGCCIPR